MTIALYFVRADDANGENLDLLVRAASQSDAKAYWRTHWADLEINDPLWAALVPDSPAVGVIPWETILKTIG